MKKKITNNWDLKLLALLFSVLLWLIVVNIDDPVKTVMFSGVEVKILNGNELEAQGEVYEILEDTGIVNVTVKGRRSIVEDISKENIKAVADMRDLTSMDTISIKVSSNKYANEIDDIKSDIDTVKLNIEKLKKIQKPIHVDVVGDPENGYILGNLSTNINQVYIEGPESLIDSIAEAKAQLQVDNVMNNVSSNIPIKLYNADGKVVDDVRLSMNVDYVNVNQEILLTKRVPIRYEVQGRPAEGYAVTGEVTCSVEDVLIAGRKSIVEKYEAIEIPASELDLNGMTEDLTVVLDLDKYLPNYVSIGDPKFSGKATIKVIVEREESVEIIFTKEDIYVNGVPEGYVAEILTDGNYVTNEETKLKVYGLDSILDTINLNNIRLNLDFEAYMHDQGISEPNSGIYYLIPDLGLPEGAYIKDNFKIQVRISKS
ncbi:MAG: hypothetical protein IKY53_06170 [Lachnospiraceae bacterium]|nr:hypothetical protein [Lachnospiraceae bacterium]